MTTTKRPPVQLCPTCHGTSYVGDDDCAMCGGTGTLPVASPPARLDKMSQKELVEYLDGRTVDAYSRGNYVSWPSVIRMLLRQTTPRTAFCILMSKWMRYASDESGQVLTSARSFQRWLDGKTATEIGDLVRAYDADYLNRMGV